MTGRWFALLVGSLVLSCLAGCTFVGVSGTKRHDHRVTTHDIETTRVYQVRENTRQDDYHYGDEPRSGHRRTNPAGHVKGPPDQAPAHGSRRTFQYRYYPESQAYYCPNRRLYYWLQSGRWTSGPKLPAWITMARWVRITVESDVPYAHHDEIARRHPAKARRHEPRDHGNEEAKGHDDHGIGTRQKKARRHGGTK